MEKILSHLQKRMQKLDCAHADLRYVELERVKIKTQDGRLDEVKENKSSGIGIRVLKDGTFGFSSTRDFSGKSLLRHLDQAYEIAKQFSKIRHTDVKLIPSKPIRNRWQTPITKDPWRLSLKEKIAPLVTAENKLLSYRWVESSTGALDFTRKRVIFVSGNGSWIDQIHYRTGGWVSGELWISSKNTHGKGSEKIKRSWPGPTGLFRAQGYEAIQSFNFLKEASRIAGELKELKTSPETPTGTFDLILKGSILALQIHETFGHASESDRVYGYEDNFGGRTFLNPGLIGLSVASPHVTLASDARPMNCTGAGSFAYDDEGMPARRIEIVKEGVFENYLTSRETAFFLSQDQSSANMVAEDWSHYPLIRMSNLNLLPGKGSLKEMVKDTKDGILLDTESSWSIDEMRLDFQVGAEMGYRIRKGKITGLVRLPIYHGNTLDFWRSCDWVAGRKEWSFWGFSDCGKGGPYQEAFTGHGVSPTRFRKVRFGRV